MAGVYPLLSLYICAYAERLGALTCCAKPATLIATLGLRSPDDGYDVGLCDEHGLVVRSWPHLVRMRSATRNDHRKEPP